MPTRDEIIQHLHAGGTVVSIKDGYARNFDGNEVNVILKLKDKYNWKHQIDQFGILRTFRFYYPNNWRLIPMSAPQEYSTLPEIYSALMAGKKIRRKSWLNNSFIHIKNDRIYNHADKLDFIDCTESYFDYTDVPQFKIGEYTAEIRKENLVVGCTTVPWETVEKIYLAAKEKGFIN